MAYLTYSDANGTFRRVDLTRRVAIGRHPAQDIQLLDRVVSKNHAIIEYKNGNYIVVDNASRNGTFLNGDQLAANVMHTLHDGDEVAIGSTTLVFEDSAREEAVVDRVKIAGQMDSAIRTRVSGTYDVGFLPETHVKDIATIRSDYEKLRIANELNYALSLELNHERLLHKILDKAFAIFRCDRGVILVHNAKTDQYTPAAARLRSNEGALENIRISETILREVIQTHEGILSSDAMMDRRFSGSHSIILEGIRSTMSVPMLFQDELLGIIHLDSQIATGAFSEKDLHLLTGFARQAAMSIKHSQLVAKMQHEAVNRQKLGRLLPPAIVELVLEGKMDIRKGGDLVRSTVMFADIRGFTAMSERSEPQEIVDMLNEYFEVMVEIIFQRNGTLDKFIGDAIMAIWGAPFTTDEDAENAVRAAVEMQDALDEFNTARQKEGHEPVYMGIGLNTGELVAGYMGSTRSMGYTAVGDAVNTASRICNLAGPREVVISTTTYEDLTSTCRVEALPPAKVKGKREPIEIYRVLGF